MNDLSNATVSKALSQTEILDLNSVYCRLLYGSGLSAARKTCGAFHI
jgi:hypothetical protein